MDRNFALGGQLNVRITPSDVGRRVCVRRVLEIVDGRPVFGDVLGDLIAWNDGALLVTRRSGETVRVCEESLVAGKTVPRTPPRKRAASVTTPAGIQLVAARGWPADEREELGGWTLRAHRGFTRRANSVLVTGAPSVPLDAAVERVGAWYAARGLRPSVQLVVGSAEGGGGDADVDAELARRGWVAEGEALVMTAPLLPLMAPGGTGSGPVRLSRELSESWLGRYPRRGPDARAVLAGGPSVWFAEVSAADLGDAGAGAEAAVAIGRCVVDGPWVGFAAVEVAPEYRRRGLAGAVLTALAGRAAAEGAHRAYLQVETGNAAAQALYRGVGFTTHHTYHYRCAAR